MASVSQFKLSFLSGNECRLGLYGGGRGGDGLAGREAARLPWVVGPLPRPSKPEQSGPGTAGPLLTTGQQL